MGTELTYFHHIEDWIDQFEIWMWKDWSQII